MGTKARALPNEDPLLASDAGADSPATGSLDDVFTKPLSELLAYAPLNRGRSSMLQARAVADNQENRVPLFLERDAQAVGDEGLPVTQGEPACWEESRQDPRPTDPPAHRFGSGARETSTVSFARLGFFRYAGWVAGAAFTSFVVLGAIVFFGGSFSGSPLEAKGMKQGAQTVAAPVHSVVSFDQTFAALTVSAEPEQKPKMFDPSASSPTPQGSTVATAKVPANKSNGRAPAPPAIADLQRRIGQAELATLLKRGRELIEVGDIASARLLLQRAADAREPQAAIALAGTYDPAVLSRVKAYGIAPDPVMARTWYEKAREFGSSEAQQRPKQLQR